MTASEHTPIMRLSQFGPDDRPSWIDDYNADMRTIDAALTQGRGQPEPLFCTAQVEPFSNFTVSTETLYMAAFSTHEGNINVDRDTHTIPITKSGYYTVSGYAEVNGVTLGESGVESSNDKSLALGILKNYGRDDTGGCAMSYFNKSYEHSDQPDYGKIQSCTITPVIVHLNAGDTVTMMMRAASNATIHGTIATMYLTLESKTFDSDAS